MCDIGIAFVTVSGYNKLKNAIKNEEKGVSATIVRKDGSTKEITLSFAPISQKDREIILDGCLINNYRR